MIEKIVIYGIGKLAELLSYSIKENNMYEISAYAADKEYISQESYNNLHLVDFENIENIYPPDKYKMFVLVGYKSMRARKNAFLKAKEKGYRFVNYIDKSAILSNDAVIGENNILSPGIFLECFGKIGDNNVIRPKTYIGHDFEIGSHNYISPCCNIASSCIIGNLNFIGIGTTITDKRHISDETLIGAASLVVKDTEPHSKYIGSPAKKVGEHKDTGIIL